MSRVLLRGFLLCLGLLISIPALAQDPAAKPKSRFEQLIEKKKKVTGMWTLYYSDQQVLAEMNDTVLRREYIIIPSIARGISQGVVLGGMSWNFEEDAIWFFRKSEEKLFIYQRNVRFRAKANTPEAAAVDLAYSDSILYSLPILTTSPTGGFLVDLTSVFMNDELKIGSAIGPSFRFVQDRSTISKMKTFENNIEMQVNAVYSGSTSLDTVPNPRGVQVGVHYSISVLPPVGANGYKPRAADDRVGYFITAIKDFSDQTDPDHFVRYANRWNLQKLDPSIELSPPREPIRFYIEDTVPVALRPTVEAGILEWNKAFEKLGFSGAIKVDQQPSGDPNFDPENVKYNTFRWMTADAGFAMGPSRVDPRTGEILDADIIFDSSFLKSWSTRWEVYRGSEPEKEGDKTSVNNLLHNHDHSHPGSLPFTNRHATGCSFCSEKQRLNGVAAAMLVASGVAAEGHLPKEFIHEGLKEVVMHEVGHTLGLRHNFKASAWKTLEQIGDNDAGKKEGIVASVMDYAPPNIAEDRTKQGLYYTQTIGPYDYWAIEYGYKPITSNEAAELKKIASRSNEPALAYTTDEDTRSFDPDPLSARFDLGSDPIAYSRRQMKMATDAMPKIIDRTVKTGDGYQRARQAFNLLFHEYWNAANIAVRYPGGVELSRDHKPEKPEGARVPFVTVSPEKQREAMKLINDSAFAPPAVNGKELNFLAASRWSHWGTSEPIRQDIAIHDDILLRQDIILGNLLSSLRLSRIQDNEFKAPAGEDAYTLVEHLQLIVDGIFSEWKVDPAKEKYEDRDPLISSFRRNLQRQAIRRIGTMLTQGVSVPSDAKNLMRVHLQELLESAKKLSERQGVILDKYTKAHLSDSIARIESILKAELVVPNVN